MKDPSGITIRHNIKPGDIGYIIYMHGYLYKKEIGYDTSFEVYVAKYLTKFAGHINQRENLWIIEKNNEIMGSMAVVEHSETDAQLRWLLLHPDIRRKGLGKKLMEDAIAFCRSKGYKSIFLWTEAILEPAAKLYRSKGFQITEEKTHKIWGVDLTEQRYELKL
jgi:GNAT superfamily N-acetyltransferase